MTTPLDLTGQRFGRLVAEEIASQGTGRGLRWRCRCDCGSVKVVSSAELRRGDVKSCGCLQRENARVQGRAKRTHGMSKTTEYSIWNRMVTRCTNPEDRDYPYYGGRGITVCDEWRTSFEAFFEHMGRRPSRAHTIDRIDNACGYGPGNVRWATRLVQSNNQRSNRRLTANDKTQTVAQWARELGVSRDRIYSRLRNGWSDEEAVSAGKTGAGVAHRG
jgi:hypothetical protein